MNKNRTMTKQEVLQWAENHRDEWFAQVILECWEDKDFEYMDEEFFESLRDAINEQYRAAQQEEKSK